MLVHRGYKVRIWIKTGYNESKTISVSERFGAKLCKSEVVFTKIEMKNFINFYFFSLPCFTLRPFNSLFQFILHVFWFNSSLARYKLWCKKKVKVISTPGD